MSEVPLYPLDRLILELVDWLFQATRTVAAVPSSSEYGTHETVKAIFWPLLSGKSLKTLKGAPTLLGSGLTDPDGVD